MRSGFYARKLAARPRRRPYKKTLSKKVSNLSKKVGNKERKLLDTQINNVAFTAVPIITQLTNVAQGNSDSTRIGSKITIVGIEMRYLANSDITGNVRVLLVQNRQANGATITAAELFQDATAIDAVVSVFHKDFRRKFRILYDKVHNFSNNSTNSISVHKYLKCNIPIRYDANVGDITDLQSNSLSYVTTIDLADASAVQTVFIRLYFTDS